MPNGLKSVTYFACLVSVFRLGVQCEQQMFTAFDLNIMSVIWYPEYDISMA